MLQPHLLLGLKVLRGKQQDMITRGIDGFPRLDFMFPFALSDSTLRRHRQILEPHVQKQNHLKDRTTKHMRI